jgi:8-oxo-dGTP pyrophosphatase MutT (NUDIX family)
VSAVVAAIVRQSSSAGAEILLIRRAEDERDPWSGHMALPGGHRDPSDRDLVATALRETLEEVGLDLARDAELLGPLESARALSGGRPPFDIYPFVFALAGEVEPRANPREVHGIVWAKLDHLLTPVACTSIEHPIPGAEPRRLPAFDVDGHVVWGLTYRILSNLLQLSGTIVPAVHADHPRKG